MDKLSLTPEELGIKTGAEVKKSVKALANAVNNSGLKDRALTVLLKDVSGVPMSQIQRVINGIRKLDSEYIK